MKIGANILALLTLLRLHGFIYTLLYIQQIPIPSTVHNYEYGIVPGTFPRTFKVVDVKTLSLKS